MAFIETPTFMRLATEFLTDDEYRDILGSSPPGAAMASSLLRA